MQFTNIYQAKTHLSSLIDQALEGKEIIIARNGKPLVQITPYKKPLKKRTFGSLKGSILMSEDFNAEDDELNKLFYEGGDE